MHGLPCIRRLGPCGPCAARYRDDRAHRRECQSDRQCHARRERWCRDVGGDVCGRMAVADSAGPDRWSTSCRTVSTVAARLSVITDSLVEDVHDGLHCSTRRPCCRGLLHRAPRLLARALRGRSQCVQQTDAKLGHTVHVKRKQCKRRRGITGRQYRKTRHVRPDHCTRSSYRESMISGVATSAGTDREQERQEQHKRSRAAIDLADSTVGAHLISRHRGAPPSPPIPANLHRDSSGRSGN